MVHQTCLASPHPRSILAEQSNSERLNGDHRGTSRSPRHRGRLTAAPQSQAHFISRTGTVIVCSGNARSFRKFIFHRAAHSTHSRHRRRSSHSWHRGRHSCRHPANVSKTNNFCIFLNSCFKRFQYGTGKLSRQECSSRIPGIAGGPPEFIPGIGGGPPIPGMAGGLDIPGITRS